MRRSVREALVGFSLLAAIASGLGLVFWLRGISLGRQNWRVQASFQNAAGLAARSPVAFRGVIVGSVRSIQVTPQAVLAELEITDPNLVLPRPTFAQVGQASLLGGDAQVALLSQGSPLPAGTPGPQSRQCDNSRVVCPGSQIPGMSTASLDSVMASMQRLLDQVEKVGLITDVSSTVKSFDQAAKEVTVFLKDGRLLVRNINGSVRRIDPMIDKLNATSAHVRNLASALDNPKTIEQLQTTVSNAEKLTARWDQVGGDVEKLTGDQEFMNGIRAVAIGLGKFFDELYPGRSGSPKR